MKKYFSTFFIFMLFNLSGKSQVADSLQSTTWKISPNLNLYLIPEDVFVLPILKADKNVLHLEGRYNYEDYNTFSAWAGYNFKGGNKFEYAITPMIGGVIGNTKGVAAGVEFTLNYKKFELYSEAEFLMDADGRENDYLYDWTDFTYSPKEWLWFGISGQRTRLVQTELDIQRGVLIGSMWKSWQLSVYFFNLGFDDHYGLISLSYEF